MRWILLVGSLWLHLRRNFGKNDALTALTMFAVGLGIAYNSFRFQYYSFPSTQLGVWGALLAVAMSRKRISESRELTLLLPLPINLGEVTAYLFFANAMDVLIGWLPFTLGFCGYLLIKAEGLQVWTTLAHALVSLILTLAATAGSTVVLLALRPSLVGQRLPWEGAFPGLLERIGRRWPYLAQELGHEVRRPLWLFLLLLYLLGGVTAIPLADKRSGLALAVSTLPLLLIFWSYFGLARPSQLALLRVIGADMRQALWNKALTRVALAWAAVLLLTVVDALTYGLNAHQLQEAAVLGMLTSVLCTFLGLWSATTVGLETGGFLRHQSGFGIGLLGYFVVEMGALLLSVPLIREDVSGGLPPAMVLPIGLVIVITCSAVLVSSTIRRLERMNIRVSCARG